MAYWVQLSSCGSERVVIAPELLGSAVQIPNHVPKRKSSTRDKSISIHYSNEKLPTTPEGMKQTFGKIPRSLIALETGTHSPWVSRLLTELGDEVIVAHAQKVQLITKSNRK